MLREPSTILMMVFTLAAISIGAVIIGGLYLLLRRGKK